MSTARGERLPWPCMSPLRPFTSFLPSNIGVFSRVNYGYELTSVAFMSMVVACVDGGVLGVIAQKAFDADRFMITLLASAPVLANLTSALWARWLSGHDRVRATVGFQLGVVTCVALIAAAPFSTAGQWMLVVLALLARALVAGIITARSDLWRANYPRRDRGRITGKLTIIATILLSATSLAVAALMDAPWTHGQAFRVLYPAVAIAALAGVWSFSHIHWRGRAAQLALERRRRADGHRSGARAMVQILRTDRAYRGYMVAMFVLGLPNIAAIPVFIIALDDTFTLNYTQSILLTQVLPVLVPVLVIPFWARRIDRMHIIRFRVFHAWFFVVANGLMGLGLLTGNLPVVYASRIILGIAFGGGMLAWNLGHHDFARRDLATIYMGIHVTLTGVRGIIGPFLGLVLYAGWHSASWLTGATGSTTPSAHAGLGGWTFIVLAAIGTAGALLFLRLHLITRSD